MKIKLTYDELVAHVDRVSEMLIAHVNDVNLDLRCIIAISRGGLTAAHRLAYKMKLPVECFFPKRMQLSYIPSGKEFMFFVEDVLATGRTYELTKSFMTHFPNSWMFCPLVADKKYYDANIADKSTNVFFCKVSEDWIVFPHEDTDVVIEGDRGLFRDGTAQSLQPAAWTFPEEPGKLRSVWPFPGGAA